LESNGNWFRMAQVDDLLELPFHFLRIPNLKLKLPNLPSSQTVFLLIFASYFFVTSGIIYDVINEPPSIGSVQDPRTGAIRPVVILQNRINGQYIIEGLSAGFLIVLGSIGFILLDVSTRKGLAKNWRLGFMFGGVICIAMAFNLMTMFFRVKLPGYFG